MKSSIRVSKGGRSITFKGGAARRMFESMTGTTLPPQDIPAKEAAAIWRDAAKHEPATVEQTVNPEHLASQA